MNINGEKEDPMLNINNFCYLFDLELIQDDNGCALSYNNLEIDGTACKTLEDLSALIDRIVDQDIVPYESNGMMIINI